MATTNRRRIVRRAVMALAAVVLLPVWYVASLMTIAFLWGADALPSGFLNVYIVPADWYCDRELPGSEKLIELFQWIVEAGERAARR